MKTLLSVIILTLLTGCGGGGGGGGDTTPNPEPEAAVTEKSYSLAALYPKETGTIYNFELKGSISEEPITGSISLARREQTMLDGIIVFPLDLLFVITVVENNSTISSSGTTYFDEDGYQISAKINLTDTYCYFAFPYKLPDTVKINDFDDIPDLECDDGQTTRGNWKIENAGNGNIHYIINTTILDISDNITSISTQTLKLNPDGKILSYTNKTDLKDPAISMTVESI